MTQVERDLARLDYICGGSLEVRESRYGCELSFVLAGIRRVVPGTSLARAIAEAFRYEVNPLALRAALRASR